MEMRQSYKQALITGLAYGLGLLLGNAISVLIFAYFPAEIFLTGNPVGRLVRGILCAFVISGAGSVVGGSIGGRALPPVGFGVRHRGYIWRSGISFGIVGLVFGVIMGLSLDLICALNILFNACTVDISPEYQDTLIQALQEGAHQCLLVKPGPAEGVENVVAIDALVERLSELGLGERFEIRLFYGPVHTKSALIDDQVLIVGSQNLHYSAFGTGGGLTEYSFAVEDPQATADFVAIFEYDGNVEHPASNAELGLFYIPFPVGQDGFCRREMQHSASLLPWFVYDCSESEVVFVSDLDPFSSDFARCVDHVLKPTNKARAAMGKAMPAPTSKRTAGSPVNTIPMKLTASTTTVTPMRFVSSSSVLSICSQPGN